MTPEEIRLQIMKSAGLEAVNAFAPPASDAAKSQKGKKATDVPSGGRVAAGPGISSLSVTLFAIGLLCLGLTIAFWAAFFSRQNGAF